jgi:hypothetical protein
LTKKGTYRDPSGRCFFCGNVFAYLFKLSGDNNCPIDRRYFYYLTPKIYIMKRILLALVITALSVTIFSSCTKEYYTTPTTQTYLYDITPQQWSRVDGTSDIFQIILSTPAVSNLIIDEGMVNVAISYDSDPDFYEIIPAEIADYSFSANYAANPGETTIYARHLNRNPISPDALRVKISVSEGILVN